MTDSITVAAADKVTQPGCYDHTMEFYHSDCCDGPSISSSEVVTLDQECPAKYWLQAGINPNAEREKTTTFEIGTMAHLLLLEPEKVKDKLVIVKADDWRTDAAKKARIDARKNGKVAMLPKEFEPLQEMREALHNDPVAPLGLEDCEIEKSYYVKDAKTGLWLKSRPDGKSKKSKAIVDYKTASSVNPKDLKRAIWDNGYHIRASFQKNVIDALTGEDHEYWFIAQEKKKPYLVVMFKLNDIALGWGNIQARHAVDVWAECLKKGAWPGYSQFGDKPGMPMTLGLPGWAEFELEQRHEKGEFES